MVGRTKTQKAGLWETPTPVSLTLPLPAAPPGLQLATQMACSEYLSLPLPGVPGTISSVQPPWPLPQSFLFIATPGAQARCPGLLTTHELCCLPSVS